MRCSFVRQLLSNHDLLINAHKVIGSDSRISTSSNSDSLHMDAALFSKGCSSATTNSLSKKKTKSKAKEPTTCDPLASSNTDAESSPHWNSFLCDPLNLKYVAPVTQFPRAPLADIWEDFAFSAIGKVIELPNPYVEAENGDRIMWVATVQCFAGYKALVEFERFEMEPRYLAWTSFCSSIPKRLGFSIRHKILLYPMHDVAETFPNYLDRLEERLDQIRTIDDDHSTYIRAKLKANQRYPLQTKVEVLDRSYISRVRMGTVTAQIGDLVHISYDIAPVPNDEGFVFSVHSDSIHALGWAKEVGAEMFDPVDGSSVSFPVETLPKYPANIVLEVGQLIEARHPLDPYSISTAVIDTVLNHGYFMVSYRTTAEERRRPTRYCFHLTSPYIFPVGFCQRNGISRRKSKTKGTESEAPLHLLPPVGQKFEAMDINDPGYMGPVTVVKVSEHLLLLQYDGWPVGDPTSVIWMSADSPNIFPLGYAELIGYKFQNYPSQPLLKPSKIK